MSKSGGDSATSPSKLKTNSDGQSSSHRQEEFKESKISGLMGGGTKTDNLVMSL